MKGLMLGLNASLLIFSGGAFGALFRMMVINGMAIAAPGLPWGMIIVNVFGSFIIGLIYQPLMNIHLLSLKYFLLGGMLGAFTTFSTFALDVYLLIESRRYLIAAAVAVIIPLLSILAVIFGACIYRRFV